MIQRYTGEVNDVPRFEVGVGTILFNDFADEIRLCAS